MDPKDRGRKKESQPRHDQPTGLGSRTSESRKANRRRYRTMHHSRRVSNRSLLAHKLMECPENMAIVNNKWRMHG